MPGSARSGAVGFHWRAASCQGLGDWPPLPHRPLSRRMGRLTPWDRSCHAAHSNDERRRYAHDARPPSPLMYPEVHVTRMTPMQQTSARQALDERFAEIAPAIGRRPPAGWIRAVREALGMSSASFAERLGVSPSRVSQLERAELRPSSSWRRWNALPTLSAATSSTSSFRVPGPSNATSMRGLVPRRAR